VKGQIYSAHKLPYSGVLGKSFTVSIKLPALRICELAKISDFGVTVPEVGERRMRWAGHVERMGERRGVYRVLVEKPEGKNHLGDPGVDGRTKLRWIFRKWYGWVWIGSSWLRIGTYGGHL